MTAIDHTSFDWDALHNFGALQTSSNSADRQRLIALLHQLSSSNKGWQLCADIITGGNIPHSSDVSSLKSDNNDQIRFFACQVIERFLQHEYVNCNSEVHEMMKNFLSSWLHWYVHKTSGVTEPVFIKNKVVQLFSLVCICDYPTVWPSFYSDFVDFVNSTFENENDCLRETTQTALDMFFAVLLAIDDEVVTREIPHSDRQLERNTVIKDYMREHDVPRLVEAWYCYLKCTINSGVDLLTRKCLKVISLYVSWIEITLIVNQRFIPILLNLVHPTGPSNVSVRRGALSCLSSICRKGMLPDSKVELIQWLSEQLDQETGLWQWISQRDSDLNNAPTEYLEKVGLLINTMGLQLIDAYNKYSKEDPVDSAKVNIVILAVEHKVDLALRLLANEDDDVSNSVSQLVHEYITLLKQIPKVSSIDSACSSTIKGDNFKQHTSKMTTSNKSDEVNTHAAGLSNERKIRIQRLLSTLVSKMQYADDYNFEKEGQLEVEFQEYRKELRVIISNLAQLDSELVVTCTRDLLRHTLGQWNQRSVCEVEVALTFFYHLGEALKSVKGDFFGKGCSHGDLMCELMTMVCTSEVSAFPHSAVQLQYFELVIRYDKFFSYHNQLIPNILTSFLDNRGVRNPNAKVRTRSAYLLSRFIRSHKTDVQQCTERILASISDLLTLPGCSPATPSSLSPTELSYIYETASQLIVSSAAASSDVKLAHMRTLHRPILSAYPAMCSRLSTINPEACREIAQSVKASADLLSRTSRAFTPGQSMSACGCVPAFLDALSVLVTSLEAIPPSCPGRPAVCVGVRAFLHRMVICMDDAIPGSSSATQPLTLDPEDVGNGPAAASLLSQLPHAVRLLIRSPVEMAMLGSYGDDRHVGMCRDLRDLIPLFIQVVTRYKKRALTFSQEVLLDLVHTILAVLSQPVDSTQMDAVEETKLLRRTYYQLLHSLISTLPEAFAALEPSVLQEVLHSIVTGCSVCTMNGDAQGTKLCFSTLRQVVLHWGGDSTFVNQFAFPHLVPALVVTPAMPEFVLQDAQFSLALKECANCYTALLQKQGDLFVNYLRHTYFPSVNINMLGIEEFIQAMKTSQNEFQIYLNRFYINAKSS